MKFALLFTLFFAHQALALPPLERVIDPKIDAIVQAYVAKGEFAGVVLVQDGNRALHFQSYGMAVREHNVANQLDTAFRIGSLTKQFTAAQIMKLQEEGRLSVEDSLARFFPDAPQWQSIKLKQLLTHTSGLPGDFPPGSGGDATFHKMEELIEIAKKLPVAEPGRHFLYSNVGFTLLAAVIGKVTGREYVISAESTLQSIGLSQTGPDHDAIITPGMALGYVHSPDGDGRSCCFDLSNLFGAGEIRSSALDLSRWMDILLNNSFLSESSRAHLWAPHVQMEHEGKILPGLFYGYGWSREPDHGRELISHNGSVPGFSSDLAIWPVEGKRIIVLSNQRNLVSLPDGSLTPVITSSLLRMRIQELLFPAP